MAFSDVLPFLTAQRRSLAIAFCLMLGEASVELSYPLFMALLINRGVLPGDQVQVMLWGLAMVALALLSFTFGVSSTFFASDAGQSFAHDLRAALFRRLAHTPSGAFQRLSTSSMLTRLTSDVNQMQNAVFMCVRLYLRSPLIILGAVLLAFWVNARLASALLLVTPLIGLGLGWTLRKGMALFRRSQEQLDRLTALVRESVNGVQLIRAYGRGGYEVSRFAGAGEAFRESVARAMRLSEMVAPSLILLLNLCILAILWSGHQLIVGGRINRGDAVAVLNYAMRIIGEFAYLSMILTNLSMAKSALGRTVEVLSGDIEHTAEAVRLNGPHKPAAIRFERVSFAYPGEGAAVLRDLSFAVEAGQTAVIVASTGSGKTTLLQLLTRFHEPDSGRLLVDGVDVKHWGVAQLRQRIGYVPQTPMLASGTVRENLLWGKPDASHAELVEAARQAQIHDAILKLPQGYETRLDTRGANLSGGQRQRLSIARALVRKPDLLLLDDCTSSLDARTEAALLAALGELGCTVVFATQKIIAARRADVVLLLENGALVGRGRHEALVNDSVLYRDIVASQSQETRVAEYG